ncbi:alkaline phosphatase PhoX [Planctomycetota bacterium]
MISSTLGEAGMGETPGTGGTSTIVYDTKSNTKIREFLSLAGTIRNCAGGPTPWKTWITCEETVFRAGEHAEEDSGEKFQTEKDHGYNFEVPVSARMELATPIPLTEMGRFHHEAVAVDPKTGIVYQTEDRDDGIFYRFLSNSPGNLIDGGRLQALVIKDKRSADTRNWKDQDQTVRDPIAVGQKFSVEWLDLDDVTSPEDDLRVRGFDAGAARFARGEGIWYGNGEFYFACTNGGKEEIGQIWRYRPSYDEGTAKEQESPGELELFIEPNDTNLIHNADNLTVSPWGDLIVCEDRDQQVVRLVGVTPDGKCYPFALNHMRTEFAGVTFSPDGSTLFVNLQHTGHTLAIRGPWQQQTA